MNNKYFIVLLVFLLSAGFAAAEPPANLEAYEERVLQLAKNKDFKAAVKLIDSAEEKGHTSVSLFLLRALFNYGELLRLERLHKLDSEKRADLDWKAKERLIGRHVENVNFIKNNISFDVDNVIALNPTLSDAYYYRALVDQRYHLQFMGLLGSMPESEKSIVDDFTKAISLTPENHKYYQARAEFYTAVGKESLAQDDLLAAKMLAKAARAARVTKKDLLGVWFAEDEFESIEFLENDSYRIRSNSLINTNETYQLTRDGRKIALFNGNYRPIKLENGWLHMGGLPKFKKVRSIRNAAAIQGVWVYTIDNGDGTSLEGYVEYLPGNKLLSRTISIYPETQEYGIEPEQSGRYVITDDHVIKENYEAEDEPFSVVVLDFEGNKMRVAVVTLLDEYSYTQEKVARKPVLSPPAGYKRIEEEL